MELSEFLGGTMNITILGAFYTLIGAVISVILFHLFDDYNEDWQKEGLLYQLSDISIELGLIGSAAFWTTHIIRGYAPIFHISKSLDIHIDTYISGLFFAFAMFLFLEDLSQKIKFLYHKYLHRHFVRVFPENWTITKQAFGSRKTENNK